MMGMYSVIVNPLSGGGTATRCIPEIKALLNRHRIEYRIDKSERYGDTKMLAARAVAEGLDGIIAVGGDGTFFEIVNGIGESGIEVIFAPCGTGNDFIRYFDLPEDTVEAVSVQLDSPSRRIDIGKCNDTYFLNVSGSGFDVDVLIEAERFKSRYSGFMAYFMGAMLAIRKLKTLKGTLSIDGGPEENIACSIISVGNGRYIGGGMLAVPSAHIDDGYFDVIICRPVNRWSIPVLLGFFMKGKHAGRNWLSRTIRCKSLRLKKTGMMVEADGEIFPCDDALFQIIPGALNTRLPI
jgi:diacylglycerol kinase (ATP)